MTIDREGRPAITRTCMRLALVCALIAAGRAEAEEMSGREVIARMLTSRTVGSEDATSVLRLDLLSGNGSRVTRTVATYSKQCGDESRNLAVFQEPAEVAGEAVLTASTPERGYDAWLYLPELGRVRQVNPAALGETFFGTDFTYEDLGAVVVDAREHRLASRGTLDGEPVYRVESTPRGADTYGKVVTWVSRTTYLPVRIDYFNHVGVLLRSGRFSDVRVVKGIPTPFAIEMTNIETGHLTRLTLLQADYYQGPECDFLTERHLARGP